MEGRGRSGVRGTGREEGGRGIRGGASGGAEGRRVGRQRNRVKGEAVGTGGKYQNYRTPLKYSQSEDSRTTINNKTTNTLCKIQNPEEILFKEIQLKLHAEKQVLGEVYQ